MRSRSHADAAKPDSGPGSPTEATPPATGSLSPAACERLRERLELARRRARVGAPVLVAVSEPIRGLPDPAAAVLAARRGEEPWFCLEQPEHDGRVIAALGAVHELSASGPQRVRAIEREWLTLSEHALCDPPAGPQGAGLLAIGGFAFAPDGGGPGPWERFGSASLQVPELALSRSAGEVWLTVAAAVQPDDVPEEVVARLSARVAELAPATMPMLDPAPVGRFTVRSLMAPSHYEEAVARAVERINRGELEKVVLAREVDVEAPAAHDPGAVFGALRTNFPACFIYAVGRGAQTLIGATPELLIRREGQRASTVALAGTTRRSGDRAVDEHLGRELLQSAKNLNENLIVARRIATTLKPHAVWVTVAPEPVLIRVANVQHLARAVRAQLAAGAGVLTLAAALHPTPAVGGEPDEIAQRLIPALEGFDRGWYAGGVGWVDTGGDGEFCVALRCALLDGAHASCFAGAGIVAGSEPPAELAETEVKLQAMLSVLAG